MVMIGKVLRLHHREKKSVREIAKATSLARNTVRKYLRLGKAEPPQYRRPAVPTKLAPYVEQLEQSLRADARRPKKERRSAKALLEQLKAAGYAGGYSRLTDYIRAWRLAQGSAATGDAYVPLSFELGEAFQFDWSEEPLVIGGVYQRLQVAHMKLCASRAFWLVAYPSQGHEMLFDAHTRGFAALGGVARRGIYDNMKTAVDKVRSGKERDVNARFSAMVDHFLFEAEFCNPASGWEKGQVEKNVRDARHRLWQPVPEFPDLATLNAWLEARCQALWAQIPHGKLEGTVADAWAAEQPELLQMPRPFDGFVEYTKRVSPTCLVTFERIRYSVPASFANRPVSLRAYADRVVVAAEGKVICEHPRVIERRHDGPGSTVYDWRHYLAVLQRKPGALRNGAPFAELPAAFQTLQKALLKQPGGDREMVDVLALVLQHDEQAVLAAVELALEAGVPTKMHVINLLHRLVDGKTVAPPPVTAPQALQLINEPEANVLRYDALREPDRKVSNAK